MKIEIKGNPKERIEIIGEKDNESTRDEVIAVLQHLCPIFEKKYKMHVFNMKDTNEGVEVTYVDHI